MQITRILLLITALINLTACSSMTGNVIPDKGPSMEQLYDGMGKDNTQSTATNSNATNNTDKTSLNLTAIRKNISAIHANNNSTIASSINHNAVLQQFHKLPNPELELYVFPHLAGHDQVPVPGYYTEFNAYEQDHYALPQEGRRG